LFPDKVRRTCEAFSSISGVDPFRESSHQNPLFDSNEQARCTDCDYPHVGEPCGQRIQAPIRPIAVLGVALSQIHFLILDERLVK
jgi:hypothetical protein